MLCFRRKNAYFRRRADSAIRWTFFSAACTCMISRWAGLISFSFTFVPMLLFTAVKNTVSFAYRIYNKLLASSIFRLGTSTSETVQHLAAQQETNSFPLR